MIARPSLPTQTANTVNTSTTSDIPPSTPTTIPGHPTGDEVVIDQHTFADPASGPAE